MKWKWPVCLLMWALFQLPSYGIESKKSSWAHLETQIGNKVLRLSVPGDATIKPYFSLEDPALYASNAGALLLDKYWAYNGIRNEYGGVRCFIDINLFRPDHTYNLKSYEGLSDAVEDSRKFDYQQEGKRFSRDKNGKLIERVFDSAVERKQLPVNNTIWASYRLSDRLSSERRIIPHTFAAALDDKHYIRIVIETVEFLKHKKARDKWFPKAEALVSEIANSLQLSPVPDKNDIHSTPRELVSSQESGTSAGNSTPRAGNGYQGTISGNMYTFPGNIFNCTIPSYSGETGWSDIVHEKGGSVTFWNQLNLDRIDCFRFEREDQEAFSKGGPRDALYETFFKDVILPSVYSGIPDAELQYGGMVPIGDQTIGIEQLYMAYMRLPHKGNSLRMEEGKRIIGDAYRCWLIYAADGYFFGVSSQGQADLSKDRWIQEMTAAFQRCSFGRWWEK